MRLHNDTRVGGECQQLVVVHNSVHRLDPVGIQIAVANHPLGICSGCILKLAQEHGEYSILPLTRCHVDIAVEFCGQNGFGIQVSHSGLEATLAIGFSKDLPASGFGGARCSHDEIAMSHRQQLGEVNGGQNRVVLRLISEFHKPLLHLLLEIPVALAGNILARKQIAQQVGKDDQVVTHNFRKVEISQRAEKKRKLRLFRLVALEITCNAQHAFDSTQTPVVVHGL